MSADLNFDSMNLDDSQDNDSESGSDVDLNATGTDGNPGPDMNAMSSDAG